MSETGSGLDRAEFNKLVRDALANLYDYAALETHPLQKVLIPEPDLSRTRAEQLRGRLLEAIEKLRPAHRQSQPGDASWRPYLILRGRYVEGNSPNDLQDQLALSSRHLRREHSRALQAVASLLWSQAGLEHIAVGSDAIAPASTTATAPQEDELARTESFVLDRVPLDIAETIQGVVELLNVRAFSQGSSLRVAIPTDLPRVLADRVVLRQILLNLLCFAIDMSEPGPIKLTAKVVPAGVELRIRFEPGEPWPPADGEEQALDAACYWADRLQAKLNAGDVAAIGTTLSLTLPQADECLLLVIDDQEAALRLFQRYLARTDLRVVSQRDARDLLTLVRRLRPSAITLDVMMPHRDGWEIMQALQADPELQDIPVIICSAWAEPDLALSLGAVDFLKKPIIQRDLLAALARLGLVDNEVTTQAPP